MFSALRFFFLSFGVTSTVTMMFYASRLDKTVFSTYLITAILSYVLFFFLNKFITLELLLDKVNVLRGHFGWQLLERSHKKIPEVFAENHSAPKEYQKSNKHRGILILLVTVIVSFIYTFTSLEYEFSPTKKAIQGGVFLLFLGLAFIYYLGNRGMFSKLSDRISFFTGCSLGPPTVIEFLF